MVCKYFIEDYLGFCITPALTHIPSISEMERLCFNDFNTCPIYNKYKTSHVTDRRVNAPELSTVINIQRER